MIISNEPCKESKKRRANGRFCALIGKLEMARKGKTGFVRVGKGVEINGKTIPINFFHGQRPGARFAHFMPAKGGRHRIHVMKADFPEIEKEFMSWSARKSPQMWSYDKKRTATLIRGEDITAMTHGDVKALDADILADINKLARELGGMHGKDRESDEYREKRAEHAAAMKDLQTLGSKTQYEGGREESTRLRSSWGRTVKR